MHEYLISDNDAGQRLDKFVQKAERGIPPSLMYRLIRQRKIKINGKRAARNLMPALNLRKLKTLQVR